VFCKVTPGNVSTTPTTYTVAKRNVLKTLITVFGCFVLCYSCNEIVFLLYYLGVEIDFSGALYHFSVIAVFANCCMNPVVYVIRYNEFKNGFKRLLQGKWPSLRNDFRMAVTAVENTTNNWPNLPKTTTLRIARSFLRFLTFQQKQYVFLCIILVSTELELSMSQTTYINTIPKKVHSLFQNCMKL
jgi:hypothetical protein